MTEERKKCKKSYVVFVITTIVITISTHVFGGVYKDDEFGQNFFFVKHTPSWKFYFYSPRSLSDKTLEELPEDKRIEQMMFDEFVSKRKWYFPVSF